MKSQKISFLISVKNESKYIYECLKSIKENSNNYEIIIINDHSTDNTEDKIKEFINLYKSKNIFLFNNEGYGKIDAFNQAYKNSSGNFIKLVGGDDVLGKDFKKIEQEMKKEETLCHDLIVTNESLKKKFTLKVNEKFINEPFENTIYNLKSIGSGSWLIPKNISDKIFPIPHELIFEDVWISNIVKRFSKIKKVYGDYYYYRKNNNQTYGVYNINKIKIEKLYKRNLKMLNGILENSVRFDFNLQLEKFQKIKTYYEFISKPNLGLLEVLKTKKISLKRKIKVILLKKFTIFYPFILKLKNRLNL